MSRPRSRITTDVVLTPEAIMVLHGEPLFKVILQDNKYLSCKSITVNGYFTDLLVRAAKTELLEVSIPSHFILYTLSASPNTKIGFTE